jgi:FkbM family methyltransferase
MSTIWSFGTNNRAQREHATTPIEKADGVPSLGTTSDDEDIRSSTAYKRQARTIRFSGSPPASSKLLVTSMAFLSTRIKHLSIAVGLYRSARWLLRSIRPQERQTFREDFELYRALLPAGALAFDVGANIGEKSEALLRTGARVVAFEPNRLVVPELRARCGAHEAWTLVEAALGSGPRVAILHARRSHGQSSLAKDWEDGQVIASFPVPVVTLDAAIECFGRADYCKIDVEGWELEVLNGLTQPINLISFEFHLDDKGVRNARSCLHGSPSSGRAI